MYALRPNWTSYFPQTGHFHYTGTNAHSGMRRKDKQGDETMAWEVLRAAPTLKLATTSPDGEPLLRTVHGVVLDGAVLFHSAVRGEKLQAIGRPAVLSADEVLAEVPSTWLDPERACPATTLYRSAMVHGKLTERTEGKAEAMQAIMERFQPQGGHTPFGEGFYERALRGIKVLQVVPERIASKAALGQGRSEAWRRAVAEGLWRTGQLRGLRAMLEAQWLQLRPSCAQLQPVMGPEEVDATVALLQDTYWNRGLPHEVIASAQLGSPAWVGAMHEGEVVATARAITDTSKLAYVMDVAVRPDWQGRGLGRELMALLMEHPAVARCRRVELHTKTAGPFYERLGFCPAVDPDWRQSWRFLRA